MSRLSYHIVTRALARAASSPPTVQNAPPWQYISLQTQSVYVIRHMAWSSLQWYWRFSLGWPKQTTSGKCSIRDLAPRLECELRRAHLLAHPLIGRAVVVAQLIHAELVHGIAPAARGAGGDRREHHRR